MIVVADTSPVLHLARIGRLDLVRAVLGRVVIPRTVWAELIQPGTRAEVAATIRAAAWIEVMDDPELRDLNLDPGETAAILLATALHADAILIDERRGRSVAGERRRSHLDVGVPGRGGRCDVVERRRQRSPVRA